MTAAEVRNDIEANLIPHGMAVPAMVAEVSRLQQRGYTLVFIPAFRP
jgi:intracellular sulfur oxidation DsrE/DsrF family protein